MSLTTRSVSHTTGPQICLNESSVEVWGCWVPIRAGVSVSGNQSQEQGHGGAEEGHLVSEHLQPVHGEAGEHLMGGQRLMGDALLRPAEWVVRSHWQG